MQICFIMYPWDRVEPETDTTLRLIHECHKRGHIVGITSPTNLTIRASVAQASCRIFENGIEARTAELLYKRAKFKKAMLPLAGFDAIFMRANPPLDVTALNFLDSVKSETFILNDIDGLRLANNKIYTAALYDPEHPFVPLTYVSKNREYLERILEETDAEKMILKPLNGYGGRGVIVMETKARANIRSLLDYYIGDKEDRYVILQEFVYGAENGDVRILMLNGEPIGAMQRVPASGEVRSNIHTGGTAIRHALTKAELALCKHIGPKLVRDGLYFVGLDVINDKLIEVNVLSPGGITRINKLNRVRLQERVIDFIESVVRGRKQLAARKSEFQRVIEDAANL